MRELFARFARRTSAITGSPPAFLVAVTIIVLWLISGPLFGFSDTWQLVINTGTTIVTFLMVFLIQNSQNRESLATQLKLDELIRAIELANNNVINIEEGSEKQLEALQRRFRAASEQAAAAGDHDDAAAKRDAAAAVAAAKDHIVARRRR